MNSILAFPFRHPLGDCTNNGLTSVGKSFDLYFDVENIDNIPDDSLILIKCKLWGKPAWYAKPHHL